MLLTLTDTTLLLRPVTPADEALLCQIYSSTRTEEMARLTGWTPEQKQAFLQWQCSAQHQHYQKNYKGAYFWIIEKQGIPIGRLYLHPDYDQQSVRIIDITLLPDWRNKGIGQQLLKDVMHVAESSEKPLTIHVESVNPAMQLYLRLGFTLVSKTNGVYHLLQWKNKEAVLP